MSARKKPDASLIHPVYLDTPMLLSFIATLEDGVTLERSISESQGRSTATDLDAEISGATGTVLTVLGLQLDASGELSRVSEKDSSIESSFVRQHTFASLLNRLITNLVSGNAVKTNPHVKTLKTGDLIIFKALVSDNPLEKVLSAYEGLVPFMEVAGFTPSSKTTRQQRRNSDHPNNQKSEEQINFESGKLMVDILRKDLESSPILDLVGASDNFSAIITASREFFSSSSRAAIVAGEFKVIGKVTAVFPEDGDDISVIRRGTTAQLSPMVEALNEIVRHMSDQFSSDALPQTKLPRPVIQVLPLAIYI